MAITFACPKCGLGSTVPDKKLGQTHKCAGCGHLMIIRPAGAPTPRDAPPMPPAPAKTRWGQIGSGVLAVLVIMGIGGRLLKTARKAGLGGNPPAAEAPPTVADRAAAIRQIATKYASGPIALPPFPDLVAGREIEPGVMFHEVVLGPPHLPIGTPPGRGGRLWVYLPPGEHAEHSLPCILIAPAGTTLLTGIGQADGDRAEHLPYARAGFAVVAFELDGWAANGDKASEQEQNEAIIRFLAARAGLVNAHVALEYALAKIPAVDPGRISAAGHSSAGTLAVLFAEHEPRLRSCVAYAPAPDLERTFGPESVAEFRANGIGDLAVRYSPKNNEDGLKCPLFLFGARDDTNTTVDVLEAFAADLRAKGKAVTLDVVPSGGHYESMIREGVPRAIDWLQGKAAEARP